MRRGLVAVAALALGAGTGVALWLHHRAGGETPTAPSAPAAAGPPVAGATPSAATPTVSVQNAVAASGVPIHLVHRRRLTVPEPPFGPAYERLAAAAKAGDVDAQYELGLLLYQCRDVPADSGALERDIEKTYETRRRDGWDVSDPGDEERSLRRRFDECAGVPAAERDAYRDWLKKAADAGLLEAQLDLPLHLPQAEYCQFMSECSPAQRARQEALEKEAVDYLGRARDGGSAMALWTFGAWYAEGDVLPQDNVQAYAYFSALDQVFAASGESRRFDAMLADLKTRLRPADLDQAQARARELLSNPKCCVLPD